MDFKNERLMMSKEEARNRAKELLNENQVDLITKYMFLEQQVKKQKEVIDKLSKIIYEIDNLRETTGGYPSHYLDKLLDILKDVE